MEYILLIISAIFVNNVVLAQFLGVCPFLGVSNKVSTAIGMSGAVTFVMVLATMVTYIIHVYVLIPLGITFMQTITFILVIASAVQFTELTVRKVSPPLFQMLGIYLPLITTNCAVLGVALLLVEGRMSFMASTLFAFASSVGYSLVMVIFAGQRERLAVAAVPRLFAGPPIGFIVASLLAMAFMGFSGISTG